MNKKVKIIIVIVIFVLSLGGIVFLLATRERIEFVLNGQDSFSISLSSFYTEEGYKAEACSLFGCHELNDYVEVSGEVNNSVVGVHEIVYHLKYKKNDVSLKRVVEVVDNVAPVIELVGAKEINVCPNSSYEEMGYSAIDNYDGDITNKVTSVISGDSIMYTVVDSSKNEAKAQRNFVYTDKEKPKIALKGKNSVYLDASETYKDDGVTITDNCDGNISNKVKVEGLDDLKKIGKHEIIYTATDAKGNTSSVKRTVYVYDFKTDNIDEYKTSLNYYIKAKGYNVSIGYSSLVNEDSYKYNANKVYYGASLIKTLGALYAYEKMGLTEDLKYCVKEAISISSNSCHRKIVDAIGIDNLRNYGKSLGAKKVLTRGNDDYFGNTIVDDQLIYMKYLYNFVNTNALGEEFKSYFINTHYNYLSYEGAPVLMHKYGYYGKFFHESGIVFDEEPYILTILSEEANHDYSTIFRDLSKKINGLNALSS